ncbi:flagellar protein FlaG [Pseudoalteromonas sp. L23]|uniref:flagellar protein FlaG n=1 Tax=unclassified Pseudoalteromonas TaxID=194690 RepID=UPI001EEF81E4|nr:flagellar protein FlaG [Pseudoalteromonas sp. B530]MCF7514985.1 flagellar protein FlaG [Pseudoalteromonas sp. L7]MCF7527091.1 flagellar protein FlaG [Pseudoalteromonas sp. L23]MCX2767499.1 flagellar protein FlaG [Pseudoalteromonas sp. B530]
MKEIQPSMHTGLNILHQKSDELSKSERGVETARALEQLEKQHGVTSSLEDEEKSKANLVEEVKLNLQKVNQFIPVTSTNLQFEFDEHGDPPVVKVIDAGSEEVIREIPSEEFREMAKALEEFADKVTSRGLLFDKTA